MTISEFEIKKCRRDLENFMSKHRPPAHIRNDIDFGYRIENQSIELFEIHPGWDNPQKQTETRVAKAKRIWKVYWQRSNLKWHSYEPIPEVKH